MLYTPNLVPGQGFIKFRICKKKTKLTSTGRPQTEKYVAAEITSTGRIQTETGRIQTEEYATTSKEFYGILSLTSPYEQEQWKQNGHPVTHNIVQHTAINKVAVTDILLAKDGRCFYVQGVNNPGGLNVTMVYKVEERNEMYECIEYMAGDEEVYNLSNSAEGS